MTTAVLSLGSNQGDSRALLQSAVDALSADEAIEAVAVSQAYLTAPMGPVTDQPDFHNIVLLVRTRLEPLALLDRCQAVENRLGRVRTIAGGPRTVDVDVVEMGDQARQDERLTLPHPRAHERAFVLVPWLDVDPDAVLPGHGPVAALVQGLGDQGVRRSQERVELS